MQINLKQVQTEPHLVFSRVLLSYLFSIFFVFTWLLTDDDSRPVFIKAGCDRNHPKVDFSPYDNPALTRLDRLLGLFFIAQKLLKWIQCRSDVILASSVSSFVSWQVMAFSGSLVERHASEL